MTLPMAQNPERDQASRHGQRVLVLWLCWVLLAVFLFVAGVVSFG